LLLQQIFLFQKDCRNRLAATQDNLAAKQTWAIAVLDSVSQTDTRSGGIGERAGQ
jgi:hypothetical protein